MNGAIDNLQETAKELNQENIAEAMMQIFKWGDGLAVCLPDTLVNELDLKEGDELEIVAALKDRIVVKKVGKRTEPSGAVPVFFA